MKKPMTNNYSSVSNWRDDVSTTLGRLDERTKNIDEKLDQVCTEQGNQDQRIETLETGESNRRAVNKKMVALYAFIVAVITTLSNIAFQVFH